jgi:hypothetical protein
VRWTSYVKVIERHAKRLQNQLASQIRSARPRKKHRGNRGSLGGSLPKLVRSASLLKRERWGVVLNFSSLGQKLLWFHRGTSRQRARPLDFTPNEQALARDVEADAARHYERTDRRRQRGRK